MNDKLPEPPDPSQERNPGLQHRIRMGALHEVYGRLLTDRQSEFIRLHYDEDLSFSEIAREYDVTRQAVHDAIKHGTEALEKYESVLRLVENGAAADASAARDAAQRLERLLDQLRQSGGILYDVAALAAELRAVIALLNTTAPAAEPAGED
ncbi:MAG: sigma factor-like helix-turn-helix DNA-binding protein [Candidatus Sumerlaeia bacterium]|nr:sigma factor-like helix-turn-helix DNA-binding protein [Candidatus Sumerlaeia bacterium]